MLQKNKNAFTLVELIVVGTILAILSTIGMISSTGYLKGVRDTSRITQVQGINDGLLQLRLKSSIPKPDNNIEIITNSGVIGYQGYIGDDILKSINYTGEGLDPRTGENFTMYLSKNKRYFQLLAHLENDDSFKTQAGASYKKKTPYLFGHGLGLLVGGTESNLYTPAQQLEDDSLNIETTTDSYTAYFDIQNSISGTGSSLIMLKYAMSQGGDIQESCRDLIANKPGFHGVDGIYLLRKEDGSYYQGYCDMTTHGGGWTLIGKWDKDWSTDYDSSMPLDAFRDFINIEDMSFINKIGANQSATVDARPLVEDGAVLMMHAGLDENDTDYTHLYFSQIYESVRSNPNNLFDSTLDTHSLDPVSGSCVLGFTYDKRNLWFDKDLKLMDSADVSGLITYNNYLDGGEGDAMFTNGSRAGAIFSSSNTSTCDGHNQPFVQWGFRGQDGSVENYACPNLEVGTACNATNSATYKPEKRFNLMFIK